MRFIAVLGAAVVGFALSSCLEQPPRHSHAYYYYPSPAWAAAPAPGTTVPGVSSPPPPPPVVSAVVTAPPAAATTSGEATPPQVPSAATKTEATPAEGATEQQPAEQRQPDERNDALRIVAVASQQIQRLSRILKSAQEPTQRHDVESILGDLERQREKVLQDLSELELEPAEGDRLPQLLSGDVQDLQRSLTASYATAPPPSQGLPSPSPLPPSEAW